jgi:hypothetical protein
MNVQELRKHILEYNDLPVKEVHVPEWGNVVLYVRAMNAQERDAFMFAKWKDKEDGSVETSSIMDNITASTLARVICSDPEGTQRVFTDDDIVALGKKSAAALDRIQDVFKEVNGDLESGELEKNLEGQDVDSGLKPVEEQE